MLFAQFLPGPSGPLFMIGHRPAGACVHWILVVPPLAEEMNKSRRTLTLLGQGLAASGIGLVMADLYGTGDSAGDFRDATWSGWVADLTSVHRWLVAQGATRVDLLALRGGALLAWDYLRDTQPAVDRLTLWQPVLSGRQLAAQLLRLRLAAGIMGRGEGETAATLRERLARDGWLEIAGYGFSAELFAALEGAGLGPAEGRRLARVDWFQVGTSATQPLPPPTRGIIDDWRAAGVAVEILSVPGDPFWMTQEIAEGTALVSATLDRLTAPQAPA